MISKTFFLLAATVSAAPAAPALKARGIPYTNLQWTVTDFIIRGNEGNFFSFNITDGPSTPTFTSHGEFQTLEGINFQNMTCSSGNTWFSYDYYNKRAECAPCHQERKQPDCAIQLLGGECQG
ncbi:hypothetical protein K432DRAFT_449940 [Lepidopterella palustris CBS 459.81]|uniref:Uncharacterized protein n=1 Tax=Lepidopterella palustris CBS 459.81 TaxID=1314670 RepID=A0A8E2ECE5_9PEZI|nr:hypothetical protein K432DRAFT_449940 [Lepidopterella palustris CBS 459.81]